MVEPGQCLGVERLGVIAGVVKEAPIWSIGRVELDQPHEVDAGPREPVGEKVRLLGAEETPPAGSVRLRKNAPALPSVMRAGRP